MDLRDLIARRIEAGESPDRVDAELLASLPALSDERRAALWLYAWHLREASSGGALDTAGGVVHEARKLAAPSSR
jgi:hypothetical protein